MTFPFRATLMALVTASPAAAADLADRYTEMGTMTVTLDGAEMALVIPYDTEDDSGYAEQKMLMGSFLTMNIVGQTVGEDGEPGRPLVQVTLQEQMGKMGLISAEMFDEQGFDSPLAMDSDGGEGRLTEYSFENGRLEGTVEGTFLRLADYMSEPKLAEGATPQPVTIRFEVDLPPLDD